MPNSLLSVVVSLKALQPALLKGWQGRALYSLVLEEWLKPLAPALTQKIHDNQSLKPFTVSNLNGAPVNRAGEMLLAEGRETWFRFTSFSPELSKVVEELLAAGLPGEIRLGGQPFGVLGATQDPAQHPWAGHITYEELAQQRLLNSRAPRPVLELEFASPTTIHARGGPHLPFPMPDQVFAHWQEKWNAFAPLAFPEDVRPFAAAKVAVCRYRLQTEAVHTGEETFIGCTGRLAYRILQPDPFWSRVIATLAGFTFYCGTGRMTTRGLGQTRLLKDDYATPA